MLGKWRTASVTYDQSHLNHNGSKGRNISGSFIELCVSNYMLSHDPSEHQKDLPPYRMAGIIIMSILTVVMVIANILSICTIATNHILQQSSYYIFVLSLAIADLLTGAIIMPIYIIWEYNGQWPFEKFSCEIVTALDIAFSDISIYILVLIALDKYIYITQPLLYHTKLTVTRARLLIVALWVIWLTFAFVSIYGDIALDEKSTNLFSNNCIFIMNDIYTGITGIVAFVIPFLILTYTGIRIYCIAHLHLRKISRCHLDPLNISTATFTELENYQVKTNNSGSGTLHSTAQHYNRPSDVSIRSEKLIKKATLCKPFGTVVIIIVFFLIMCAPYWIATGSDIFCHCVAPWIYEDILAVVYNLNSLVNPFIYIMTDRQYRAAVKRLLIKCHNVLCKSKHATINKTNTPGSNCRQRHL